MFHVPEEGNDTRMETNLKAALAITLAILTTGCALGSGGSMVSAYAMQAKHAENLTPEAEDRIVERVIDRMELSRP